MSVSCNLLRALGVQRTLSRSMAPVLTSMAGKYSSNSAETERMWVPEYKPRVGEAVEVKRARLLYQSRKRGMLENGLLLSSFADKHLSEFTAAQLDQYDALINTPSNDWQLYYWFTGREETPGDYDNEMMDLIKKHTQSGILAQTS